MHLFYSPNINNDTYIFSPEEAKHCKVLRIKTGDTVYITDGIGTLYTATIQNTAHFNYTAKIIEKKTSFNPRPYKLHIAISPTKNPERFEWFVEKACEIGIDEITPLICKHSQKTHIKPDRLQKIAISAMKQSFSAYLTKINNEKTFSDFIKQENPRWNKFIAICDEKPLDHLMNAYKKNTNAILLIGPEGDFDPTEIITAKKAGFVPINLGKNRLRTETAGVMACAIINLANI